MKRFYLLVLLWTMPASTQGQVVFPSVLRDIDSLMVVVIVASGEDARLCTPSDSALKTRIELRLRRAGIRVVDSALHRMGFWLTTIHPGLCAVSYETEVIRPVSHPSFEDPVFVVGLDERGIFSRSGYTASQEAVRQKADDAVDLVINEILKARQ